MQLHSRVQFRWLTAIVPALLISLPCRAWSDEKPDGAPAVGDEAPDFELAGLDGKKTKLSELTDKSRVVLVVLRGFPGYQCPLCSAQVSQFVDQQKKFREAGAQLVFVYPGPAAKLADRAKDFVKGKKLPKDARFLIDPDYAFTNAYHLRWDAKGETAYPSTFVIDGERQVRFAKISKSHGGRSSVEEVLQALQP